ncbi:MAG: hypothetical protein J5J06_02520 [Phycisphaerae bacterium]|nr:hypothetical protein [Phycisphaerae bacterium]
MLTAIGQYVGGRVVTGVITLAVIGGGIWFWRHPEHLQSIWLTIKYVLAWMGFVLVLPWATFFVTWWVVSKESNLAAGLMLAGYSLADVIVAWYVRESGFSGVNALTWVVLLLGFLSAAVYNFKVCEFLATQAEEGY